MSQHSRPKENSDKLPSMPGLLSEEDQRQILIEWNDTDHEIPTQTLPELFEEQVGRTPEAISVINGDQQLTYQKLNERANQLAHYLIGRGVGPEHIIGLAIPPSVDMVVAVIGTLKAGAAYLPLDPEYPPQRLSFMLEDAAPSLVLTVSEVLSRLPDNRRCIVLDDSKTIDCIGNSSSINPTSVERIQLLTPENAAFIIYTSGSTGSPKGVTEIHASQVNRLIWLRNIYSFASNGPMLAQNSFSFFFGSTQLLGPLLNGGVIVLAPSGAARDTAELITLIERHGIGLVMAVPSLLSAILDEGISNRLQSCKLWLVGGEAVPRSQGFRFDEVMPQAELRTLYGASEVGDVLVANCNGGDVPIGWPPIWNMRAYVLGEDLQPVPVGVVGELYVAGIGMARGYLRRPALTAERFLADPYGPPGTRMYRTGDLVRRRADRMLDCLGRADHQVKIRGFRVEPAEIEALLLQQPSIVKAVVVVRDDQFGAKQLVAYVVPRAAGIVDAGRLRRLLSRDLPDYMVPAAVMVLESLPLTPNGKLDRKALPEPEFVSSREYRAPRTPREEILCSLFAELLGVERVGLDDDFFELGGHSLMVTRLASRIRTRLGVELAVRTVFESPTAGALIDRLKEGENGRPALRRYERPHLLPLSSAQQAIWFLDQLQGNTTEYNISRILRLKGDLNVEALRRAVNTIAQRHESLRTRFLEVEGRPVQMVESNVLVELPLADLSGLGEEERSEHTRAIVERHGAQPFDLARAPLFRMQLLRLGDREHLLLQSIHHIVSDGWSQGVFGRELMVLYGAFREGLENPLKPLAVQYADFVLWQRQILDEGALKDGLNYWAEQLAGIPEKLELPTDRPRPPTQTFEAGAYHVSLDPNLLTGLKRLSQKDEATVYMTLLAAFAVLLSRRSGQHDIVVGSPIANRLDTRLEDVIGFFANLLVMRISVIPHMTFRELLRNVKRTALQAYRHQDIPLELLVHWFSSKGRIVSPLFQVVFGLHNFPEEPQQLKGLFVERVTIDELRLPVDLAVSTREADGRLEVTWLYNQHLFEKSRIEEMALTYKQLLERIVVDPTFQV